MAKTKIIALQTHASLSVGGGREGASLIFLQIRQEVRSSGIYKNSLDREVHQADYSKTEINTNVNLFFKFKQIKYDLFLSLVGWRFLYLIAVRIHNP